MVYPMHRRYKGENLLPEEDEVLDALTEAGYTCDPDGDFTLFTPMADLYQTYTRFVADQVWREPGLSILTKQQFGAALLRVYGWEFSDPGYYRTRRWAHGRRHNGVYHLKGPATVRVLDGKGRRPHDHDSFVD